MLSHLLSKAFFLCFQTLVLIAPSHPGILAPIMPAFYRASITQFLTTSETELTGLLTTAYALSGFDAQRTSQTRAWLADLLRLQDCLHSVVTQRSFALTWSLLLEFPIPRKEKRIDVVILAGCEIVVLELKTSDTGRESLRQAEEYALLLHYFHQPSNQRKIHTFLVAPSVDMSAEDRQGFLPLMEAPAYWVSRVQRVSWSELDRCLARLPECEGRQPIDSIDWDLGEYRPVPTILDAALSLRSGLNIREVAHSRAARHDVDRLTRFVARAINDSRSNAAYCICFITGVPGSGKTLVGLNLAFTTTTRDEPIHFMSGTGPLVDVLQAVLADHHKQSTGVPAQAARMFAKTLIENVHVFAKTYSEDPLGRAPSNHVIIFDEAQRAWDREQNWRKFRRDYSEPEMLLRIMERHSDWAVLIALVGGGQEINSGEAGLAEWGRALEKSSKAWTIFASEEALEGGSSVAGSRLLEGSSSALVVQAEPELHLDVSIRNLGAETYASWVNAVVSGNAESAAETGASLHFPIILTRSLTKTRAVLLENTLGLSRCGLVGSSGAARLRAEGLEPDSNFHGEYPWPHWYLGQRSDVRSSFQLEVFATEFEIQGLELDWIGVCWGGDYVWSDTRRRWLPRVFRQGKTSRWSDLKDIRKQQYRSNAYRVLLTRARQGVVLFVPEGDPLDPTRSSREFDETAAFLLACGARELRA